VLIAIGSSGWPDVAMGGFHSQAGWLAFNAVALGLVAIAGRLPALQAEAANTLQARHASPAAPYLLPFLVGIAAAMVTTAFTGGFNEIAPLRVLAVASVLWFYRDVYEDFAWVPSWHAVGAGAVTAVGWIALVPSDPARTAEVVHGLEALPPAWAACW